MVEKVDFTSDMVESAADLQDAIAAEEGAITNYDQPMADTEMISMNIG